MQHHSHLWKIAAFVLIAAILAGCQTAQPSLEPTVNTEPTFSLIQTQAVQTAVMNMTLNAPSATPVMFTETSAPTEAAPTMAAPTETATTEPTLTLAPALPTATPTRTLVPWTVTPAFTATSSAYNCTITEQSPPFGYDLRPGIDFDGKWIVKNTGTQPWVTSEVDIKYVSGTKFQSKVDMLDLSANVAVGGSYTIIVDMFAPTTTGRYSTAWAIVRGGQTICTLPITIDVVQ